MGVSVDQIHYEVSAVPLFMRCALRGTVKSMEHPVQPPSFHASNEFRFSFSRLSSPLSLTLYGTTAFLEAKFIDFFFPRDPSVLLPSFPPSLRASIPPDPSSSVSVVIIHASKNVRPEVVI